MYFARRFNLASSITKFNYALTCLGWLDEAEIKIFKQFRFFGRHFSVAPQDANCWFTYPPVCASRFSVDSFRPNLFHLQTFPMFSLRLAEKSAGSKSCRFIFRCKNRRLFRCFLSGEKRPRLGNRLQESSPELIRRLR